MTVKTRVALWFLLAFIIAANGAFDLTAGRMARHLIVKAEGEKRRGNPSYFPYYHPLRPRILDVDKHVAIPALARYVFGARFALTALPLLVVCYIAGTRRLRDSHIGMAISVGAFVLAAKAGLWETLWLITDVYAASF